MAWLPTPIYSNVASVSPSIVLCSGSAGGHLALMTLVKLRQAGLPKIEADAGLTHGQMSVERGENQFGNDPYDLVQRLHDLAVRRLAPKAARL